MICARFFSVTLLNPRGMTVLIKHEKFLQTFNFVKIIIMDNALSHYKNLRPPFDLLFYADGLPGYLTQRLFISKRSYLLLFETLDAPPVYI